MGGLILFIVLLATAAASAHPTQEAKFLRAVAALEDPGARFVPAYRRIAYPMGDVPAKEGVCADVVVRAYRAIGIDLQARVHDDMKRHFALYPRTWRMRGPDTNIDHRRVLNLRAFFARHGKSLKITNDPRDYKPGDLVTWNLDPRGSTPHIGIVSPKRSRDGQRRWS